MQKENTAQKIYDVLKKDGVSYTEMCAIFNKITKEVEKHVKDQPLN